MLEVKQAKARNCSIVVMQPQTGKILAMAQYPTLQPDQPVPAGLQPTRDIAVTNVFAPGSTLKPMTVAADAGAAAARRPIPPTPCRTRSPWTASTFHDAEPHATAQYTMAGILANSLNDGMVQIVQHITPQAAVQLPARLRARARPAAWACPARARAWWSSRAPGTTTATSPYEMSFGQGISVTAIQTASIYATIANGGVRVQPSLVAGTTSSAGKFCPRPRRRSAG